MVDGGGRLTPGIGSTTGAVPVTPEAATVAGVVVTVAVGAEDGTTGAETDDRTAAEIGWLAEDGVPVTTSR